MAFDQATRNRLARFVGEARALLTEEFTRQLQLEYGLDPQTGARTELDRLTQLDDARRATAAVLRATLDHYLANAPSKGPKAAQEALDRIVREQAFTVLNRLCALRMAEARGLVIESVAQGYQSRGFQLYTRLAGAALGETGDAYRAYLFSLFDELAVDLPVLFDRFAPEGRLFPREAALLGLLALLNHPDLAELWAADETVGWVYQYFNSQEERRQMRAESQAPRNSRELAVRNQFFTPRYVVEFLADNTLGRTWYEMTRGQTGLVDSCRYLVRRPNEVFLAPGEQAPAQAEPAEGLSQEELLQQPVHIPHRPLKDPRAILMLDPACGSMHFGLYAFDLFERIYEEAWELEAERGPGAFERAPMDAPLTELYPDREALLRDVPRLIVERNIHGVDIDPRAVQIAGLALWLRAQRSWRERGVKAAERPAIRRSNVVCAEPMPGDPALLDEFVARQLSATPEDRAVAAMLRRVFKAMELAGEAGSLLRIEEEITSIVAEGKKLARQGPRYEQPSLFGDARPRPTQGALDLDVSGLTDEGFWQQAEGRIYAALEGYASFAEGDGAYRRRLFADDARQGLAFMDLCQRRYDVVLMNPPFGAASAGWKATFERVYLRTKNDLYAAFVERGVTMLRGQGVLGAITSRTGFFLSRFQDWREEILLKDATPTVVADLGYGVLDAAMVETAAYCLQKDRNGNTCFYKLLEEANKADTLALNTQGKHSTTIFEARVAEFNKLPGTVFSYWVSEKFRKSFETLPQFEPNSGIIRVGVATGNDFRFLRTYWEIPLASIHNRWRLFAKGGEFSKFYSDVFLVVDWLQDGLPIELFFVGARVRKPYFFLPGITWSRRSQKGLSLRALPAGCLFSEKGPSIFASNDNLASLLGLTNSRIFRELVSIQVAFGAYEAGVLQRTPTPVLDGKYKSAIGTRALCCVALKRKLHQTIEISHEFHLPALIQEDGNSLKARAMTLAHQIVKREEEIVAYEGEIDDIAFQLYGIEGEDRRAIEKGLGSQGSGEVEASTSDDEDDGNSAPPADASSLVAALISYLAGAPFGRWDIRYATGERAAPELPDPFAPLPVCPPGMLQNARGLPAAPEDVPANYPLRISWPGILVDDEGHPEDIVGRARDAIAVIWGERAEAIEQEACSILGVRSLREYFARPAGFFADHLARYSKSRRQAPIYWPLSTASGSYTLWLYYHRLSDQTLYSCVNDFVEPKIRQVQEELGRLRQKAGRSRAEEKELERLSELAGELADLRAELLRVAAFWKPNLNDGVQITAAPLWRLFLLKPWQKRLKETWEKLEQGEYDWAHLAYSIWPERVREKCRADKSLAIAHDLEALYVAPPASAAKKRGRAKKAAEDEDSEE